MIGFLTGRFVAGLGTIWSAGHLYLASPVLLALALIPTVVRVVQILSSGGTPEGTVFSEAFVGVFRVLFALAVLAVASGWAPLLPGGSLQPPSLAQTGSAWAKPDFDLGLMITDLAVYAVIYGLINLALATVTGQGMIGNLIDPGINHNPDMTTTLALFVGKNLTIIPVATIHILWALRLVPLE